MSAIDRLNSGAVLRLAARMLLRDWRAGEQRVLAVALIVAVASLTTVAVRQAGSNFMRRYGLPQRSRSRSACRCRSGCQPGKPRKESHPISQTASK